MRTNDLKKVFFVCEATDFEVHKLWEEYAKDNTMNPGKWNTHRWEQLGGWLETVGYRYDMPICISVRGVILDGRLVMFWHATSVVVDHRIIDEWLTKEVFAFVPKWDNGTRKPDTNPMNFHHCINAIEELNKTT
jgi:hypothetical protein